MAKRFDPDKYVDVQERITRFWTDNPDGAIRTRIESLPDNFDACRYVAKVFKHRDHAEPDATGWAFELAGGNGANSTSHEENCETSAIGRALANMGYATSKDDRPSRQEMQKAERGSAAKEPADSLPDRKPSTTANAVPQIGNGQHVDDPTDFASSRGRRMPPDPLSSVREPIGPPSADGKPAMTQGQINVVMQDRIPKAKTAEDIQRITDGIDKTYAAMPDAIRQFLLKRLHEIEGTSDEDTPF